MEFQCHLITIKVKYHSLHYSFRRDTTRKLYQSQPIWALQLNSVLTQKPTYGKATCSCFRHTKKKQTKFPFSSRLAALHPEASSGSIHSLMRAHTSCLALRDVKCFRLVLLILLIGKVAPPDNMLPIYYRSSSSLRFINNPPGPKKHKNRIIHHEARFTAPKLPREAPSTL